MGFETQKIILKPSEIVNKDGETVLIKRDGSIGSLPVGDFEMAILSRFDIGITLSQIILEMRSVNGHEKFQRLYDFLNRLCLEEFIANKALIDFMDQSSEGLPKIKDISSLTSLSSSISRAAKKLTSKNAESHVQMILNDESKSFTDRFLQLPFVRNLPPDVRDQILGRARKIKVKEGTTLIREGENTRDLYVLIDGSLGLYKFDEKKQKHRYKATLNEGAVIGEAGFFLDQKRTASLLTLTDCKVVKIEYIDGLIQGQPSEERALDFQKRIWFMQSLINSPYFKYLPPEAIDILLNLGEMKDYESGSVIYEESSPSNSLGIVIQGEVEAFTQGNVIRSMGKGEIIGEIGVLSPGTNRTLSVRAKQKSLLCEIPNDIMWKYFSHNFILAVEFERLAHERLSHFKGQAS